VVIDLPLSLARRVVDQYEHAAGRSLDPVVYGLEELIADAIEKGQRDMQENLAATFDNAMWFKGHDIAAMIRGHCER